MSGATQVAIELLPARQGDALLLRWGADGHRHTALVDAGPAGAYDDIAPALRELDGGVLDLLVLSHVDADHVEGTICLVNDRGLDLQIRDVWFNGGRHLTDDLAPVHGEILGTIIHRRGLPWNAAFGNDAVHLPDQGGLQSAALCCGLTLTVLGPSRPVLRSLRDAWKKACKEAGLDFGSEEDALAALRARPKLRPEDSYLAAGRKPDVRDLARRRTGADPSVTNASSIVLLAEVADQRLLLAGDATPATLSAGVTRLLARRGVDRLPLTVLKMPHHGSQNNITAELVRQLPAEHYLFSSNGAYFKHPDPEAVATVLENGPRGLSLVFNYANPRTAVWDDPRLKEEYGYTVTFPGPTPGRVEVRCGEVSEGAP